MKLLKNTRTNKTTVDFLGINLYLRGNRQRVHILKKILRNFKKKEHESKEFGQKVKKSKSCYRQQKRH